MTIYLENENEYKFDFDIYKQLEKIIKFVVAYLECPYEVEVSVSIVSKEEIKAINNEFRKIDKATDVLSFPRMEYEKEGFFEGQAFEESISISPESQELLLGDIVLCYDIIKEQAKEYGHSDLREFSFLTVHSMLHLFGFDHIEEEDRLIMEDKQKDIMDKLEIYR